MENACYCEVQNILPFHLLSEIVKIKTYNLLYGCATWLLTLREEHRLRMSAKQGAEENIWTYKDAGEKNA
jgi:hypothetical protein